MPKATDVEFIVIHCTAGFGNIDSLLSYWRNNLGWKSPGYHFVIDLNGNIHQLMDFTGFANGVKGHNSKSIHIAYIGGIEVAGKDKKGQFIYKGKDTRTDAQKYAIEKCLYRTLDWLEENGKDTSKNLWVGGHRDFSPDRDGNGIIAPFERVKECPCFDAMAAYKQFSSKDRRGMLPTSKPTITAKENFVFHSVTRGETLSKIAQKHKTTYQRIMKDNGLATDVIRIGQKLKIYG